MGTVRLCIIILTSLLACDRRTNAFLGVKRGHFDLYSGVSPRAGTVSTLWFDQKLDHLTPGVTKTWKQRYFVNEDYLKKSPNYVYLTLGGEWPLSDSCPTSGAWIATAQEYGGLLVCLEHRYYGESQPLEDLSTENLKYLSSVQALEDAATFIQFINKKYNLSSDAKWIVYGGSYPGSLAAWLRLKFPHLVTGGVSHSGPLTAILEFNEYLEVVINDFKTHSAACVDNIKSAYAELTELTTSCLEDPEIYQYIDRTFDVCESLETSEGNEADLANFFEVLTDNNFAYVAQYNMNPNFRDVTVNYVCEIMNNQTLGTPVDRLGHVNKALMAKQGVTCLSYKYQNMITKLSNVTADPNEMIRQWFYQTCTEFGFFQTSQQEDKVFGSRFDIVFFLDICIALFGPEFSEESIIAGIEATNNRYGGVKNPATNVVYVNGDMDPWHVLSKLKTTEESGYKAIMIPGASHCAAYYSQVDGDSQALINARKEIHKLVGQWLTGKTVDDGSGANALTFSWFTLFLISVYAVVL